MDFLEHKTRLLFSYKCPGCKQVIDILENEKEEKGLLHPMPVCIYFEKTDDPVAVIRAMRHGIPN